MPWHTNLVLLPRRQPKAQCTSGEAFRRERHTILLLLTQEHQKTDQPPPQHPLGLPRITEALPQGLAMVGFLEDKGW